jgi:hypothetical protein
MKKKAKEFFFVSAFFLAHDAENDKKNQ